MLTVAQITDLHITTDKDPANCSRNEVRLRAVLKAIHELSPRPVAIVATGDLVDRGEPEEYAALKRILHGVEIPIHLGVGNHDRRAAFRAAFPETKVDADGFVQYAVDLGGLRLVMCDTLEEGKNGGAYCRTRAAWLRRTLRTARRAPTIVAAHHPPIVSGIRWMDPDPDEDWIGRISSAVYRRHQVQTIICGHLHRSLHATFAGKHLSISPASAPQLTLNLSPINMREPDGREIVVEEPPGYSLLMWYKDRFAVHNCVVGDYAPVVTYEVPFHKGFA